VTCGLEQELLTSLEDLGWPLERRGQEESQGLTVLVSKVCWPLLVICCLS
jgi:hypothetical protein